MTTNEVIEVLNDDMGMWAQVMGHFSRDSIWFEDALKRVKALREAIRSIKDLEYLEKNSIRLGEEYWSDRYQIDVTIWEDDWGVPRAKSFRITPIETTTTTTEGGN